LKEKVPEFEGNFSAHSLKASSITIMCASDLSDFRITARSGHSSKAVEAYKRTLPKNLLEETEILFGRDSPKKRKMEATKEDPTKVEPSKEEPKKEEPKKEEPKKEEPKKEEPKKEEPKISCPLFNINFNAPVAGNISIGNITVSINKLN